VRDRDREYTLRGSESRTLAAVGVFRVVSSRDLGDHHDRPADPPSGDLRHLREQGLIETVRRPGSREHVVTLTKGGRSLLEHHWARDGEHQQTFYAGVRRERERGARIERVVLDYELKREYQKWLHDRDRDCDDYDGHPDRTPEEIREWAYEHDLPYFDDEVHFPDVRIDYQEPDGRWDYRDVEVTTGPRWRPRRQRGPVGLHVLPRVQPADRRPWQWRQRRRWAQRRPRRGALRVNFDDRVKAVSDLGFTERQARFLVTVMLYASACVPRQYATFAGTAYGHTVSRFFDKLVRRGYATVCGCLHHRVVIFRLLRNHIGQNTSFPSISSKHSAAVSPRYAVNQRPV